MKNLGGLQRERFFAALRMTNNLRLIALCLQVLPGAAAGLTANVAVLSRLRLKVTELRGPETAGVLNLKL